MNNVGADGNIVEKLRKSVQSYISTVGADNEFAQTLIQKIEILQKKLEELTSTERNVFLHDMKDSFAHTIAKVESKLQQYANFEKARTYSVVAAVVFVILLVFALFGYKLYKSLKEKERKRQEKLKTKQSKKSKKSN